jgi:hypothetical protein
MPYCSQCGAQVTETAKYCPKCGTAIGPVAARPRRIQREPRKPMGVLVIVSIILIVAISIPAILYGSGYWHTIFPLVGSGNIRTQEMNYDAFTAVSVGSGFKVEITQSPLYNVTIAADDNLFDAIQVSKTNDRLIIGLLPGRVVKSGTLNATITMPDLDEVTLSGGSQGTLQGFLSTHDFVLDLSGGSRIHKLKGSANDLFISASGGSQLNLFHFMVHNATVNLSGGSRATINLDGRLDATLSGGSQLYYYGDPTLGDIVATGGSTVSQK